MTFPGKHSNRNHRQLPRSTLRVNFAHANSFSMKSIAWDMDNQHISIITPSPDSTSLKTVKWTCRSSCCTSSSAEAGFQGGKRRPLVILGWCWGRPERSRLRLRGQQQLEPGQQQQHKVKLPQQHCLAGGSPDAGFATPTGAECWWVQHNMSSAFSLTLSRSGTVSLKKGATRHSLNWILSLAWFPLACRMDLLEKQLSQLDGEIKDIASKIEQLYDRLDSEQYPASRGRLEERITELNTGDLPYRSACSETHRELFRTGRKSQENSGNVASSLLRGRRKSTSDFRGLAEQENNSAFLEVWTDDNIAGGHRPRAARNAAIQVFCEKKCSPPKKPGKDRNGFDLISWYEEFGHWDPSQRPHIHKKTSF